MRTQISRITQSLIGFLYGMDEMTAPAIFSSVVAPAFKDVNYNCYLYTLDGSGLTSSFAADNSQFVSLIPSNAQFETADPQMRLYTTTSGKELQEYSSDAGAFVQMGDNAKLNLVNMHISDQVTGEASTISAKLIDCTEEVRSIFVIPILSRRFAVTVTSPNSVLVSSFNWKSAFVCPVDSKYSYFPFAFNDGCIHFIDGLLK
jgi:hypothetical protein